MLNRTVTLESKKIGHIRYTWRVTTLRFLFVALWIDRVITDIG